METALKSTVSKTSAENITENIIIWKIRQVSLLSKVSIINILPFVNVYCILFYKAPVVFYECRETNEKERSLET